MHKLPQEDDCILSIPRTGGVFSHHVCWSFSVQIHEILRNQIMSIEKLVDKSAGISMKMLAQRLKSWNRRELMKETDAWLIACPILAGMYQFTFTETVRHYSLAFPVVKTMGIRIPSLTDFVYCLLVKVYDDPVVTSGSFGLLDNARTFVIISQRLNAALCEAIKVTYFPKFSPATSVLWKIEPQLPNIIAVGEDTQDFNSDSLRTADD
jgi:hypothetical protein